MKHKHRLKFMFRAKWDNCLYQFVCRDCWKLLTCRLWGAK